MVLSEKHEYDSFAETNENKHLIDDGLATSEAETQEFIASKSKRTFGVGLLASLVLVMLYAAGSSKGTARINLSPMTDESEAAYILIPASEEKTECPQDTGVSDGECFEAALSLGGKYTPLGSPLRGLQVGGWPWSPCGCTVEPNIHHDDDDRDGYWTYYKSKGGTACTNDNPQGGIYFFVCKNPSFVPISLPPPIEAKYILILASEEKTKCPQDTGVSHAECFEAALSLSGRYTPLGYPLRGLLVGGWPSSPCGCSTQVDSSLYDPRDGYGYWTYYKSQLSTACTNNSPQGGYYSNNNPQGGIYFFVCKNTSFRN